MESMAHYIQPALNLIVPFLLGAALGMLRVGRVIQQLQDVSVKQEKNDERNSAAHEKLFDGLDHLRRDVNGSIGRLNMGLTRVGTTVETLPCRPQGHRPPDDCPGGG